MDVNIFEKFLIDKTCNSVQDKNEIFIKMISFSFNEIKEHHIYPIYYGKLEDGNHDTIYEVEDIPSNLELCGYYIEEKEIYLDSFNTKLNGDFKSLERKLDFGVEIEMRNIIYKKVSKWFDENFDKIELGEPREGISKALFDAGYIDIDLINEKIKSLKSIAEKLYKTNFHVIPYIVGDMNDIEKEVARIIKEEEEYFAIIKAERNELLKLVEEDDDVDTIKGRARKVKRVFQNLKKTGLKNCTAVFDFGYTKVSEKVKMSLMNDWINGSTNKSIHFEEKYFQPLTMKKDSFHKIDYYLAYIVSICSRGKEIYHTNPMEIILENELYNAIMSGSDSFAMEKFSNADCSMLTTDGKSIAEVYIWKPYSTVDGMKFLIEHGADKKSIYEYMTNPHSGFVTGCSSRDWKSMLSYLESIQ